LAQEIIVEIYSALETVEEINNFPAWVWSIARYTFYKWLGKQKKNASIEIIGPIAHEEDVIKKAIQKDELNRLRREISFLSERYRKIIILHYFENKSCKEIAELLSIPPGTVKWYLYDARKKIKWGMEKMRIFGEGSYRPGYLNFGIQGQLGKDNNPRKLAERMIPQNILLKAYEEPVSVEELSELLGIARPYMEEEVKLLLEGELLREVGQGKVQTNFIIADIDKTIKIGEVLLDTHESFAEEIISFLGRHKKEIMATGFYKGQLSWARILWVLIPLCIEKTVYLFKEEEMNIISFDELPRRKDGGRWLGIGTERVDLPLERIPLLEKRNVQRLEKLGYNGPWIDNKDNWGKWWLGTVRHGFVNEYYQSIQEDEFLLFKNIAEYTLDMDNLTKYQKEILSYAIQQNYIIKDGNELTLNFPIFYKEELATVNKILERVYTEVKKIFNKLYEELASVIREGMPKFLEKETDNYIFALIFDLVPLTFEYALDRQIITKPESEAPYLTFYIWYKK